MAPARKLPAKRKHSPSDRKIRLTVSLGEDTVRFLTQRKVEVKAASMSACVESLVATCRRQSEAEKLNTQMLAYYDGISDQERAENTAWGQMAEHEFKGVEI
jgi:hypothetical protein